MARGPRGRIAHACVQAEVADQALGRFERRMSPIAAISVAAVVTSMPGSSSAADLGAGQRVLGEVAVDAGDLCVEEVDWRRHAARVSRSSRAARVGKPAASALAEDVAGGRAALEVSHEHRGHLVLTRVR